MILISALQLLLLNTVYGWTTENRMKTLAYELALDIQNESFEEIVVNKAEGANTAAFVFRVEEGVFSKKAELQDGGNVTKRLGGGALLYVYQLAVENEGILQVRTSTLFGDILHISPPEHERLITALIAQASDGEEYLLLLDTDILPLRSLFHLLQNQLMLVSLISLTIAAVLAFLLARHIAAPIERISKKADLLPRGKYDIDFSEKSYREIEELSSTLNQTADELSKTDRLQKELIANISHDLRTPLTTIVGYAEMMRDIEGENTPENIDVIIDEATRLSSLVNDLLEISRIQGGTNELKCECFNLADLARETVDRYRRLKENSGFDFDLKVTGNCRIYADKAKILQVICNLINNAIHYSENERRVSVRVFETKKAVRLEVEDHGIGIAPEQINHVWERYYRGEKNHRRRASGSGLGLSIVREVLDLHQARYGVSSVLGEGSVFWLELSMDNENLSPECV